MAGDRAFYPHACAFCNKIGADMKICEKCSMVSYCSNKHQANNWPEHEEICKAIQQTRRSLGRKPHEPILRIPWEGWTGYGRRPMLTLVQKLQRDLTRYEREMCEYPVKCNVYCETNNDLVNCPNCASVSYCVEHKDYATEHREVCNILKQCFYLDVINDGSNSKYMVLDYMENIKSRKAFRNMMSFGKSYISAQIKDSTIHSEYFTHPLTVLYGLEKIKERENPKIHNDDPFRNFIRWDVDEENEPEILDITSFVIHVIGAGNMELVGYKTWEVLFHFIESLKDLSIIMIGPELGRETGYSAIKREMCRMCRSKNLSFECHDVFYEDYVRSPLYKKPDLTVAFNVEFSNYTCGFLQNTEIWKRSIQAIANQNCPFILTSSSVSDNNANMNRVADVLQGLRCDIHIQNPYAGLRPHRMPDNETFGYSNCFASIYTVFSKNAKGD